MTLRLTVSWKLLSPVLVPVSSARTPIPPSTRRKLVDVEDIAELLAAASVTTGVIGEL